MHPRAYSARIHILRGGGKGVYVGGGRRQVDESFPLLGNFRTVCPPPVPASPAPPAGRFLTYLDVPAYVRGYTADGGVGPPVSCYDVAVQLLLLYSHPVDIAAYSAIIVQCHILKEVGT
jgi:hypothetical protein